MTLVPAQHATRYSLALAPMYLCFAGAAIGLPRFACAVRGFPVPFKWIAGVALVVASCVTSYNEHRYLMTQLPVEVLPAGKALRELGHPGARVMARKPHIGYYSGMEQVPFANVNSFAELASYCRANHVDYIYFSWPEADLRPQFSYLLDTSGHVPGLTVVREMQKHPAVVYHIEEGFGQEPAWLANDELRKLHEARAEVLIHEDEAWQAHLTLALAAGRSGQYEEAISHLEAVIRWRPSLVRAHILLGEAHLKLMHFDRSERCFRQALQRDPRSVDAQLGIGWVKLQRGELRAAGEAWRPVISQTKDQPTLEEMRRLFSRTGDAAAVQAVNDALAAIGAR
jgi:tetratricopeptide (TPR) repeat protein